MDGGGVAILIVSCVLGIGVAGVAVHAASRRYAAVRAAAPASLSAYLGRNAGWAAGLPDPVRAGGLLDPDTEDGRRELAGWKRHPDRPLAPDVLAGRSESRSCPVTHEVSGTFRGREATSHLRLRTDRLAPNSASPQTHFPYVTALRAARPLPRLIVELGVPGIAAGVRDWPEAEGLRKIVDPAGVRAIVWVEPAAEGETVRALAEVLTVFPVARGLIVSDRDRLLVCQGLGGVERSLLERLELGDRLLWALGA